MTDEVYLALQAPQAASAAEAVASLRAQLGAALRERGLTEGDVVLLRFFCSDVYNQAPLINFLWPATAACQHVYIGQRPLDSAYISLQAYALAGAQKTAAKPGSLEVRHGGYTSLWLLEYPPAPGSAEAQTDDILSGLSRRLAKERMTLADNVVRTWYYLRDIDNTYAGMIASRVRHYEAAGLTPETHFIASTGIEGRSPDPHALVALQAHAVWGLEPGQVRYLRAPDHLSPTSLYGVNFERAALITYGDRQHCHISGTASIDAKGNVLHKGDVVRQLGRTLENMQALLAEGDMRMTDLRAVTVYLRDGADAPRITTPLALKLPRGCAVNINEGAVCRPDWLVEIEAEAVRPHSAPWPRFI
ncbi:MAG: hypothetical protein K2J64_09485 [Desulfovibrio sp.]|nr:hypothetical protein [Desulfovibrio sp.]